MYTFTCLSAFRHPRQNRSNRSTLHSFIIFVFLSSILAFFNLPAIAQGTITGSFVGQITNSRTGAGIPGAKVTFTNLDTGFFQVTRTDKDGQFSRSGFLPGNYEIQAEAEGYKTLKSKSQGLFATQSNRVIPVPIRLEELTVRTEPVAGVQPTPAPVDTPDDTTEATSGNDVAVDLNTPRLGRFSETEVKTLPLGGTTLTRTFDELALLIPGVAPPPQAIGNSVGPGVGGGVGTSGQFSVNGLRSRANNFTVDGSDNNDEDIGVRRQGFFSLVPQPIESIQEFSIITLLAPAEFGRNLGAQVNAISKRGTNRFNGTLYSLFNSSKLNARNFFDNANGNTSSNLRSFQRPAPFPSEEVPVVFLNSNNQVLNEKSRVFNNTGEKDPLTLFQGGFAVGGRIIRDKMFFFISGEGQLLNATKETHFAVPTIQERGFVRAGAIGLQQCLGAFRSATDTTCVDPNSGREIPYTSGFPTSTGGDAIFSLFPFANDPTGVYGQNTFTQSLSTDARGRIFSGRYDWNIFEINGNQQTFTARYNNTDDRRDLTDVGGALFSAVRPLVRTDNFSAYLTGGLTGNLTNELRFSYGRTRLRFEELRDNTFLLPSTQSGISPFLLNAPFLENVTRPIDCNPRTCLPGTQVTYRTLGTVEDSNLGAIGQLIIAGFSPVGVDVFNFPQQRVNNTLQFADTLRWRINGGHNLSFGTDIRRAYLDSDLPRNSRPLVTFNGGIELKPEIVNGQLARTGTLADFQTTRSPLDFAAAGAPSGFFQSLVLPDKDAAIKLRFNQFNFFAQDEWRILSNLNVNYGLRYEYNTTPKEADRKIEDTFNESIPSFLSGLSDVIGGRKSIYESDSNNFAPRLGIAYDPLKNGNTVFRAGFAMYYDQVLGAVVSQSRNVFPTFSTVNFGGGSLFNVGTDENPVNVFTLFNPADAVVATGTNPNFQTGSVFNCRDLQIFIGGSFCNQSVGGFIPLLDPGRLNRINPLLSSQLLQAARSSINNLFPLIGSGGSFGTILPTKKLDTPLSYQYSIGVEQRLFGDTFLSATYVGTTGRNLLRFTTPNLGNNYVPFADFFQLEPTGQLFVFGATLNPLNQRAMNFARPTPNIGSVNQFETTGRSRYDSLQLELRGRLTRNFQYQANYVFGEVNDDVSDVFDLAGASALPQNSLTFEGEYARANFDVRHRFTYNFVYDAPLLDDQNSFVRYLLGGWQIAGTGKFSSGQPFTVNSIFDVNLDGNLTDRLDNTQSISETNDRRQRLTINGDTLSLLAPIGRDGSVPRNSFRAASIIDVDLSLIKRFRILESQFLQLRVDIFNFINRANFGIPVRFLEAPGFGGAVDTVTPGRRVQIGLKYNF